MRASIALALVLAACGGGADFPPESGVDPSLTVADLPTTDLDTLCTWSIDAVGGPDHVSNCGDFMFTNDTYAECVADLETWTCTATVADYEACINATGGDACKVLTESACLVFFECSV
jgi:hypothetical protein